MLRWGQGGSARSAAIGRYPLTRADGTMARSAVPRFGGNRASKICGRLDCPSAIRALPRGEAQLILAEAVGGQACLDAINRVRALANIAPLTTVPADFTATVLEERRRQLFSEGQR